MQKELKRNEAEALNLMGALSAMDATKKLKWDEQVTIARFVVEQIISSHSVTSGECIYYSAVLRSLSEL